MFHIGDIPRNLTTSLECHYLKWLLIYGSNHGRYWFSHIVCSPFTSMVCTEIKLWFLAPSNISEQIHWILCPKLLYFLRKYTKSSKIRSRCAEPLKMTWRTIFSLYHNLCYSSLQISSQILKIIIRFVEILFI